MFTGGGASVAVGVVAGTVAVGADVDGVLAAFGVLLPQALSANSATMPTLNRHRMAVAGFAECAVSTAGTARSSRRVEDVDDEPQGLVGRDGRRASLAPVSLVGGDAEEALTAHLHAHEPVLPALDDVGERELRGLVPRVRGVEDLAGRARHADVVDGQRRARGDLGARAFLQVLVDERGGGRALLHGYVRRARRQLVGHGDARLARD